MNRLRVRLSIAFGLVMLFAFALVTLSAVLITQKDIQTYLILRYFERPDGLVSQLQTLYQQNHSWDGIDTLLETEENRLPPISASGELRLVFADTTGRIIYDKSGEALDSRLSLEALVIDTVPITIDGVAQGYLKLNRVNINVPDNIQPLILEQITGFLIFVASIASLTGLILGIFFSRTLTAPLDQLAKTARAFGAKNFRQRAEVKGTEEIVAVATAFNDMADALEQAEIQRRNLVADVAHELRTPLTVLQANLQAILDDVYPLDKSEIEKLVDQTELLGRLVNDLHELAQAESRQLRLSLKPLDLNDLIGDTLDQFSAIAGRQDVVLETRLSPKPVIVTIDANRISQVLNNLLQNALTHTPSGGRITVALSQENTRVYIAVQDSGSGIAPADLPHVFERFYRADRSRSRGTGGSGLGLAIVKALVEMHGGEINVVSDGIAGHGTTFTLTFNLRSNEIPLPS